MDRFVIIITLSLLTSSYSAEETTNYEYYTSGGIKSGLSADNDRFTLNGKNITIISGSLHYFRVPQQYWRDRLLKFKAAGLNAVKYILQLNNFEVIKNKFNRNDYYF